MKFIQTNCDRFTYKKEKFEEIIDDENPDVLIINKTALKGTRKAEIIFYFPTP